MPLPGKTTLLRMVLVVQFRAIDDLIERLLEIDPGGPKVALPQLFQHTLKQPEVDFLERLIIGDGLAQRCHRTHRSAFSPRAMHFSINVPWISVPSKGFQILERRIKQYASGNEISPLRTLTEAGRHTTLLYAPQGRCPFFIKAEEVTFRGRVRKDQSTDVLARWWQPSLRSNSPLFS